MYLRVSLKDDQMEEPERKAKVASKAEMTTKWEGLVQICKRKFHQRQQHQH
jgi:predicted metal-dependent hydrolase